MEKYSQRSGNKTDNQIVNTKTVNQKGLLFFLCPKKRKGGLMEEEKREIKIPPNTNSF